jgi:hypothetical protein
MSLSKTEQKALLPRHHNRDRFFNRTEEGVADHTLRHDTKLHDHCITAWEQIESRKSMLRTGCFDCTIPHFAQRLS